MLKKLQGYLLIGVGALAGCTTVHSAVSKRYASLPAVVVGIQCSFSDALKDFVNANPSNRVLVNGWSAGFELSLEAVKQTSAGLGSIAWTIPNTGGLSIGADAKHTVDDTDKRVLKYGGKLQDIISPPCEEMTASIVAAGDTPVVSTDDTLGFAKVLNDLSEALSIPQPNVATQSLGYRRQFKFVTNGSFKAGFSQPPLVIAGLGVGASRTDTNYIDVALTPNAPEKMAQEVIIVGDRTTKPPSVDMRLFQQLQNDVFESLRSGSDNN